LGRPGTASQLGSGPVKYALVMGSDRDDLLGKTVEA
jgi:hypothetical protein